MTDLFLDPKVLNYSQDRYELILYTLRWARILKARGSPQPLIELMEKALSDIVEERVTKEEILSNKPPAEPPPSADEAAAVAAVVAGEGAEAADAAKALSADGEDE